MANDRGDRSGGGRSDDVGQQTGSKRPAMRTGAAKAAPKKGTIEPKGTARRGVAKKSRPGKAGPRKAASKKPSRVRAAR